MAPLADQPADRPGRENFIDDFRQVGSFGAGGQSSGSAAPSQAPAQKFTQLMDFTVYSVCKTACRKFIPLYAVGENPGGPI